MSDFSQKAKCSRCGIVFCPDDGGAPCDCWDKEEKTYIVTAKIEVEATDEDDAVCRAEDIKIEKWDEIEAEEN